VADARSRADLATRVLGALVAVAALGVLALYLYVVLTDITVTGELDLSAALATADGPGCSGQGAYAFFHDGGKIEVDSGRYSTAVSLGAGHWTADGSCSLPLQGRVMGGKATYTFDLGAAGRRTVTAAELSRPVRLTIGPA
jgi:hypothetical protein